MDILSSWHISKFNESFHIVPIFLHVNLVKIFFMEVNIFDFVIGSILLEVENEANYI